MADFQTERNQFNKMLYHELKTFIKNEKNNQTYENVNTSVSNPSQENQSIENQYLRGQLKNMKKIVHHIENSNQQNVYNMVIGKK